MQHAPWAKKCQLQFLLGPSTVCSPYCEGALLDIMGTIQVTVSCSEADVKEGAESELRCGQLF